jgi:pyruvate kinase
MTDAAMAVQAECVMLNKGPNLGAGVGALDRLLKRMGEHQAKKTPTLRALHSWPERFADGGRPDGWQAVDPV